MSDILVSISRGPCPLVIKHSAYFIDGLQFCTEERDSVRITQNSGVSLVAKTMQFSSAKDKNPIYSDMIYYGIIKEIWEIDYVTFRTPVFLCSWVESNSGVKVDKNGFTFVNLTRLGHKQEPFIMASQAKQVFYAKRQKCDAWARVFATQSKDYIKDTEVEDETQILVEHLTPLKGLASSFNANSSEESNDYIREGGEGIWIDN